MWALRRAANPIRSQSRRIVVAPSRCTERDIFGENSEHGCPIEREKHVAEEHFLPKPYSHKPTYPLRSFLWTRNLSSQAGTKSGDVEDELKDGFSDLDGPHEIDKSEDVVIDKEDVDMDIPEEELDESAEGALGLLDETKSSGKKKALSKILIETPRMSINSALEKWASEGKPFGRTEISATLLNLRRRRLWGKALQSNTGIRAEGSPPSSNPAAIFPNKEEPLSLSLQLLEQFIEWVEANNKLNYTDRDYASHLDLTAKIHGLHKAEEFIDRIPESFKGEIVYRTLLANSVSTGNIKKSEEIFNRIRDLDFPLTIFACNQVLLLYKRNDRKKIADILKLMEKENIKPNIFTYRLLIDTKGRANDISGMEELVETMKAEGIVPTIGVRAMVAKYYIHANLNEKAEAVLKEIEGDIKENLRACRQLLPLYASLGKTDDVERIWKVCEADPHLEECLSAIEAWGELGKVEKAEEVFELMSKNWSSLSSRYYNCMIKVYAKHKLLSKGKDLVKRMAEKGRKIGPLTWDALVKLYVGAGEVEKADSFLQKASQQNQMKPLYCSYMMLLENYAKRGDIHNAENIFNKLRQNGYMGRMRLYQVLLQAYINAEFPAYGFRERMKADNMFPNKAVAAQLATVDDFKKTAILELLD
ncbi:pentatricopeptide repeat-containing protein At1g80270, mitochondrial-like isoform X2 [Asparagus officinalis]|uniref:pentatricopeptide repeat-containing protein At1g80270, mitochondrial-like isoform X2 n=1 Tax=Asparagus officinalis TaxID=4686 RepID=UPI00098E1E93|nr:pentatricopeptide repeat-containing protein At1g80270, mitochondrial-like isoform X2 [Asparagus officinalis]